MVSLLEVAHRARSGPKISENDWNMLLFRSLQQLSKNYGLEDLGSEVYLDIDHDYADKAFQAAVQFLVEVGIFITPANRIIKFTEEEVKGAIRQVPGEVMVGTGKDARRIRKREIEDRMPPNVVGGLQSPYSEDLGSLVPMNWAMIPRMDMIEGFNMLVVDGYEVFSPPIEAYAAIRELAWMREGVRKAGRAGMAIHYYPINTIASTMIAPMDPEHGLRRTDGVLMKPLPDLKVEVNMLTAAIVYDNYGTYRFTGGGCFIGGFCGGAAGAIIEAINHLLAGILVYHGSMGNVFVDYLDVGADNRLKVRPVWPTAVAHHALCRNSNIIRFGGVSGWSADAWGIGTEMFLKASALNAMAATVLGSTIYITRVSRPQPNEGQTPLETEWNIEVSDATLKARLNLEDVAEIMKKVNKEVEGKPYPLVKRKTIKECYDLVRHKPSREYRESYEKVKKEYADLGLQFE